MIELSNCGGRDDGSWSESSTVWRKIPCEVAECDNFFQYPCEHANGTYFLLATKSTLRSHVML